MTYVWPVSDAPIGRGDLNGDGWVNLVDAVLVLRVVAGFSPQPAPSIAADADGDGKIGPAEALFILQKIAALR